jgi:hypothetical protein
MRESFAIKKRNTKDLNRIYPLTSLPLCLSTDNPIADQIVNDEEQKQGYECEICKYNLYAHSFVQIQETDGLMYYHTIVSEIMKHRKHEISDYMDHVCGTLKYQNKSWSWIMDFTGFSMYDVIRNNILLQILDLLHDTYCNSLHQIIILHPSWHIRLGYTLLRNNIAEHIQQKIVFDRKDMFNHIVNIVLQTNNSLT